MNQTEIKGNFMKKINLRFIKSALLFFVLLALPALAVSAGGGRQGKGSEVIVHRIDTNNLIRLRVYIDGRIAGTLRVGETSRYKVEPGPHTIHAAFSDYEARSTDVIQFVTQNVPVRFNITDESIVAVGSGEAAPVPERISERSLENSVVSAFDKAIKDRKIKQRSKVAVINVDSDNVKEADYMLEELTYLAVHSEKRFEVIDRRAIDAFKAENSVGVPSYNNDYMLRYIGVLLGAEFVISGRLDGDGDMRRLRIKVLDVKTGMLIGDASERV
jgi:TolB-like protein